jgi:hypothetical protein
MQSTPSFWGNHLHWLGWQDKLDTSNSGRLQGKEREPMVW